MKYLKILLILFVAPALAENISVGNEKFKLVFTDVNTEVALKEYTTNEETLSNWTSLVGVMDFNKVLEPKEYIKNLARNYKKQYAHMSFSASGDKNKNIYWIDYIVYPREDGPKFLEWNYYKAFIRDTGELSVLQYVKREPYEKIEEGYAALDIRNLRAKLLPILISDAFRDSK